MSASRPVIANFDESELQSIIEENECGLFTLAGDEKAFVEGILNLYQDRELCKMFGENGRKFVLKNLTKDNGTKKYVNVINSIVK